MAENQGTEDKDWMDPGRTGRDSADRSEGAGYAVEADQGAVVSLKKLILF
ncbi:MAG: hypothetical protein IKS48_08405 [Eubacterium sp.]|nr:hypothetical protein [Eubacterium sp.]